MLAMHYAIDLPPGYEMDRIRARARDRGPLFAALPGLIEKAFLCSDCSRRPAGAAVNRYATFYLWQDASAMRAFLVGDRFQAVADAFGRPEVHVWSVIHYDIVAPALEAAHATLESVALDRGETMAAFLRREAEFHRAALAAPGLRSRIVGLDAGRWRAVRFSLWRSAAAIPPALRGHDYEVPYLATPTAFVDPLDQFHAVAAAS